MPAMNTKMARGSPIQFYLPAFYIFCAVLLPIVALSGSVPLDIYRNGFRSKDLRVARMFGEHDTTLFEEPFYANANGSLRVYHPRRLAIIGAGIGGISIAHAFSDEDGLPPQVTIFEREPRLGGRIHTVSSYDKASSGFVETGGGTFSTLDHIIKQASDVGAEVGLAFQGKDPLALVSIWNDGQNFTRSEVDEARANFQALPNYQALEYYLRLSETDEARLNFETLANYQDRVDYLPWKTEDIFDLEDLQISLKWYVRRGSWPHLGPNKDVLRQFAKTWGFPVNPQKEFHSTERFLRRMVRMADSRLKLNSTVTRIQRHEDLTFDVHWLHNHSTHVESFDAVVIAAPFHQANFEIDPPLPAAAIPDEVAYKSLHVTHFISRRGLDPATFSLSSQETVPDTIWRFEPQDQQRASSSAPPFVSLSRQDWVYQNGCMPEYENLYRVVSEQPLSDDDIATLLRKNGTAREDITFPDQTCFPVKGDMLFGELPPDLRDEFAAKLAEIMSANEEPLEGSLGAVLGCINGDPDVRWSHRQFWPNAVPVIDQGYNPGRREMVPRLFYVSGFEGTEGASIVGSVDNAMHVRNRLLYDYMSN